MKKLLAFAAALQIAVSVTAAVHRMEVSIVNTTSYSVTITQNKVDITNTGTGVSTAAESDFWNTVNPVDGRDIRIKDINGNPIPYWVEQFYNTGSSPSTSNLSKAVIWFKLPSPLAPGASTKVKIDYGDPSNTVTSGNGNGVFDFFDDFSSSVLDPTKWTKSTGYTIAPIITTGVSIVDVLGVGAGTSTFAMNTVISTNVSAFRIGARTLATANSTNTPFMITTSTTPDTDRFGIVDTTSPSSSTNLFKSYVKAGGTVITAGAITYTCPASIVWNRMSITKRSPTVYTASVTADNGTGSTVITTIQAGWSAVNWNWTSFYGFITVHQQYEWIYLAKQYDYDASTTGTAVASAYALYHFTGRIYSGINGIDGVSVTLTNNTDQSTMSYTSQVGGTYEFWIPSYAGGSYTVSFSKTGNSFFPASIQANVTSDVAVNSAAAVPLGSAQAAISTKIFTPAGSDGRFNSVSFAVINPGSAEVKLRVFDSGGRFYREIKSAGTSTSWDGTDGSGTLARGGIYLYQLSVGGATVKSGTVTLVK